MSRLIREPTISRVTRGTGNKSTYSGGRKEVDLFGSPKNKSTYSAAVSKSTYSEGYEYMIYSGGR